MATSPGDDRLVARAQLDFVRDLVACFVRDDGIARSVTVYQSQYIAIIALLRSVGHVFEKVDCVDAKRRAWSTEKWPIWKQCPIFRNFIEPTRNTLLKEFRGGLQLQSEIFSSIAVEADPSMPAGASRLAVFKPHELRDLFGTQVVPQLEAAITFWNLYLEEAEVAFLKMSESRR